MTEIPTQTIEHVNYSQRQAIGMADRAGFEISPDQIRQYCELRCLNDEEARLSDQQLLYLLLEPTQQEIFKQKYNNINFELE